MFALRQATALCYRLYDVAETIDLEAARSLHELAAQPVALSRAGEYLQMDNPPLSVDLGSHDLSFLGRSTRVQVQARLFEHGALSVLVQVPVEPGTTLEALIPWIDALYDSPEVEALAQSVLANLRTTLARAFREPHLWEKSESYTVLFCDAIDGNPSAEALLAAPEMPRLLLGETAEQELSGDERRGVLEQHFSYTGRDLAVVDWNAAFVYEPGGSRDIPNVLEVANAQLLELRYFDAVLEKELRRAATVISSGPEGRSLFFSPYKKLQREVMRTLIELAEFVERVENALKIVGDIYLARVYEGALRQFRVRAWQDAVTRKMRLLTQTYELLKGEVDTARALGLEATVVALILAEIVLAVLRVVP